MTAPARRRWLDLVRWLFLVAVAVFTWWGLQDRWDEIVTAVAGTAPWQIGLSSVLVVAGIAVTSTAWLRLLEGYGRGMPRAEGRAVFFVGQLGKYIPGSVWSMGAHAELARRHRIPVRTTLSTSLVFLGVNLATAAIVSATAGLLGATWADTPGWVLGGVLIAGVAGLSPWLVNRCGTWIAGADRLRLTLGGVLRVVVLQAVTWACYGGAMAVLAPVPSARLFALAAGAFATAYVVGVLVVVAPAGLGAREVTLVALLTPVLGVATATAVALLTRVLHTGGDLVLAGLAWLWARLRREQEPASEAPAP